jgi:hypothetical protein
MNDHEQDPVVARALTTMQVPDHQPRFWDCLEEALAAAAPIGSDGEARPVVERDEPSVVVDLAAESARPKRLRGSRRVLPVAIVAAIAVGLVVVSMVSSDEQGLDLSSDPPAQTTQTPAANPTTSVPTSPAADPRALAAVTSFVDALGHGDLVTAARLLGPQSEQYATATAGSVDAMLRAASEGYGSWVSSTDRETTAMVVEEGVVVVVLRGTRRTEGMDEQRVDAIPVRHAESADAWFVEPWAFDPTTDSRIELVDPAPASGAVTDLAPGGAITVTAPDGAALRFALLGRGFDEPVTTTRVGDATTARWRPSVPLPGGAQTVVVVAQLDGVITAAAIPVNVR